MFLGSHLRGSEELNLREYAALEHVLASVVAALYITVKIKKTSTTGKHAGTTLLKGDFVRGLCSEPFFLTNETAGSLWEAVVPAGQETRHESSAT